MGRLSGIKFEVSHVGGKVDFRFFEEKITNQLQVIREKNGRFLVVNKKGGTAEAKGFPGFGSRQSELYLMKQKDNLILELRDRERGMMMYFWPVYEIRRRDEDFRPVQ